jgi:Bacterial Ig-like domain (group 3)/FG-GAP-like repeat
MSRKNRVSWVGCFGLLLLFAQLSGASQLFGPPRSYNSGGFYANSIAVADVNLDGKPDLIVANNCTSWAVCMQDPEGIVAVLLGNGDGTFQAARRFGTGNSGGTSVFVADVNGDGKPDLLVATYCFGGDCDTGGVAVLLGNGDGTFQTAQIYRSGGYHAGSIFVADVNGDGKPDLAVANSCSTRANCGQETGGPLGNVGVLLGNGDGTFQPATSYASGGGLADSVAIADVNGDGKADLVVGQQCLDSSTCKTGVVGVLIGTGDGSFLPVVNYSQVDRVYSMAVADVNHDGKVDIVVGNYYTVGVLLGNGDGTFQAVQTYNADSDEAQSIAVGDVNGDGNPDLVVASWTCAGICYHAWVSVLLGKGDGSFQAVEKHNSYGNVATSVALADLNGDTKPDMVVANLCAFGSNCLDQGGAVVFLNRSRFFTTTTLSSSLNPSIYGQTVTLTATVGAGPLQQLSGTVTFKNSGVVLRSADVNGLVATMTTVNLPAGTLSITASYNGNPLSLKSTSTPLSLVVNQAPSTTTIKSSRNPSAQGQSVTFTAKVITPTGNAGGTVTFKTGTASFGSVALQGGTARIATNKLPRGSNTITATYDGTDNIVGSAASLTQIVN